MEKKNPVGPGLELSVFEAPMRTGISFVAVRYFRNILKMLYGSTMYHV
jgi:hypothetical protein